MAQQTCSSMSPVSHVSPKKEIRMKHKLKQMLTQLRPIHTKNNNYKNDYNKNYISIHTNACYCSVYSKYFLSSAALHARALMRNMGSDHSSAGKK